MPKKSTKSSTKNAYLKKVSRENLKLSKLPSFIIGLGVVCGLVFGASFVLTKGAPNPTHQEKNTLANPASVHCGKIGGKLQIEADAQGNQFGICNFDDGKKCEEWALFRSNICQLEITTQNNDQALEVVVNDTLKSDLPKFNLSASDPLIAQYGGSAYETLQNNPDILQKVKQIDKGFDVNTMQVGSQNKVATFKDQQILLLIGCLASNCAGTVHSIAIDPKTKEVYELAENPSGTAEKNSVLIYGDPDQRIEELLLYFYFNPE